MTDGIRISIETRALDQVIKRLQTRAADMRPAWQAVGRYLRSRVQITFRAQSSPDGTPWKPTLRGGQILRLTSRLRDSIDFEAGKDEVAIGTNVKYAPPHQFGATIRAKGAWFLRFKIGERWVQKKEVTIPARPFLPTDGLPADWTAGLVRVMEEYWAGAAR